MKTFIKEYLGYAFYLYGLLCFAVSIVRFGVMDCPHRYTDYLFPLSKLHCEVK
jgi:hypothetical protein